MLRHKHEIMKKLPCQYVSGAFVGMKGAGNVSTREKRSS